VPSLAPIDKAALHGALVTELVRQRDKLAAAQRLSVEGVTHQDARSEGDKDMRATEASYVARGQAMRVESLEADVSKVRAMKVRAFASESPIALSALCRIETDEGERIVFLAPAGAGVRLRTPSGEVHVVTASSPLGRALVGAREGDSVVFERGGRDEEASVVEVA
jgi:transcription elongation GreA/GreB family factor